MTIVVRTSCPEDLTQIVEMQVAHRSEVNTYPAMTFDKGLCTENMALVLEDTNHIILVAHNLGEEELLGYLWFCKVQPHYTEKFYFAVIYLYIGVEQRNGKVLLSLINQCKRISKLSGASHLEMGSFSGNDKFTEALKKRYNIIGSVFDIQL